MARLLLLLALALTQVSATEEPNFVIIMADDLGYGDLSCYGNTEYKTPQLDALAERGMRFTDFHSNGNVCSPTRAALLTGRYPQRTGIADVVYADPKRVTHKYGLQPEEFTFADALKKAGYATCLAGKWHQGYYVEHNPTVNGFDEFEGYVSGNVDFISHIDGYGRHDWWIDKKRVKKNGYTTHLITQRSIDFIERNKDKPFCVYVSHEAPHYPYQGPNDPALRTEGQRGKDDYSKTSIDKKRAYREMVQEMDKGIGEIVAKLADHQLLEKTLVMFFSDNGATKLGSNGNLRGFKGSHWEGGHRVPCIASWQGVIRPGSVTHATAMTMDIMPTLLHAAGLPLPKDRPLDGVSLLDVLKTNKALPQRDLFWWRNNSVAMRRGQWKLAVEKLQRRSLQPRIHLFDLETDPAESKNIESEHPKVLKEMQSALASWKSDVMKNATRQP